MNTHDMHRTNTNDSEIIMHRTNTHDRKRACYQPNLPPQLIVRLLLKSSPPSYRSKPHPPQLIVRLLLKYLPPVTGTTSQTPPVTGATSYRSNLHYFAIICNFLRYFAIFLAIFYDFCKILQGLQYFAKILQFFSNFTIFCKYFTNICERFLKVFTSRCECNSVRPLNESERQSYPDADPLALPGCQGNYTRLHRTATILTLILMPLVQVHLVQTHGIARVRALNNQRVCSFAFVLTGCIVFCFACRHSCRVPPMVFGHAPRLPYAPRLLRRS